MTLIIAEAGVNHNGSEELAFQLVDAASDAGADIVKFQTFDTASLVTHAVELAQYQNKNSRIDESQFSMLSKLQLPHETYRKLEKRCKQMNIGFLSTAFDSSSLEFLVREFDCDRLKIASGEITNSPLLLEHARTGLDLLVSTGMATLAEIEHALGVIAFGYLSAANERPTLGAFKSAFFSEQGKKVIAEKVTLLHCTSEYPAPIDEINLSALDTLKAAFKTNVGYSDHSDGVILPVAAVARGAVVIEKHFTLDKFLEGPDHRASLDPGELKEMVQAIRNIELAIGDGVKGPQPSEMKNLNLVRKSIVAERNISQGDMLSLDDISVKRAGKGMSPDAYWELAGKTASKSYKIGDLIDE